MICRQLRGPLRGPFCYRGARVSQDTGHGRPGYMVSLGELSEIASALTVAKHGITIELEWTSSDVAAFEPGATHAGADSLDDQVALQFSYCSDDHNSAAQRAAGVDLFAIADELDVEPVQLIENFKEVFHRPGDAVRGPDQHDIESAAAGIPHEFRRARAAEPWPR